MILLARFTTPGALLPPDMPQGDAGHVTVTINDDKLHINILGDTVNGVRKQYSEPIRRYGYIKFEKAWVPPRLRALVYEAFEYLDNLVPELKELRAFTKEELERENSWSLR